MTSAVFILQKQMRRLRVRGGEDPGEERRLPQEVLQLPQVQQGPGNYKRERIN